jgi:hypothetical protein
MYQHCSWYVVCFGGDIVEASINIANVMWFDGLIRGNNST